MTAGSATLGLLLGHRLDELGWRSPRDHECTSDPGYLRVQHEGPFALCPLVLFLLGTLARVYGGRPEDLRAVWNDCECYEWIDEDVP